MILWNHAKENFIKPNLEAGRLVPDVEIEENA